MYPNFGIYQAIVTDNSLFFNTGKIRVRVQSHFNGEFNWDLSQNYNASEFIEELAQDLLAIVYTPIGGGSGHGMFALPQVNSIGLVQFMNGNIQKPIWMGSFFRPEYDENRKLLRVNVPNDQPQYEGNGSDGITQGSNGIGEKKIEGGFGTLILRTKTTKGPGRDRDPKNMDFNEQRTENLIVVTEDKYHMTHFSKWEKEGDNATAKQFEELKMGTVDGVPQVDVQVTDIVRDKKKTTGLKINNSEVSLVVNDESKNLESSISSTSDGINIKARNTKDDKNTNISLNNKEIILSNDKVSILVEGNEISLSAPNGKLRLSGKEVLIGDGGGYVVVSDVPGFSMRMEDGAILKASSKVQA